MFWNKKSTFENVDLAALRQGLADDLLLIVDVREPHEFAAGHIPGSELMPLSAFDPAALPRAGDKQVILSCQAGVRSLKALQIAAGAGRGDIHAHFGGGFAAWRAAGEPVERD